MVKKVQEILEFLVEEEDRLDRFLAKLGRQLFSSMMIWMTVKEASYLKTTSFSIPKKHLANH
jgi:hypothetical protein